MEPASARPVPARTFYSAGQRVALIVGGSVFALMGALAWFNDVDAVGMVLYTVAAAMGVWLAVRGGMVGVRVDAKGVTERGLGRSRTVGWCSVRDVVAAGQGAGPLATSFPVLVLDDGAELSLQAVATYSSSTAQEYLRYITTARAAHRAACRNCSA
ncbi:PH domain-containing protein [Streptomyces sp. NPDC094032]|uniref:PH domain-containing protein n=1 Tax=Streptomyces sp. NPDC094032 TaxID=3155308 RepID=UPI00333476BC